MNNLVRRFLVGLLSVSVLSLGAPVVVEAGIIGTDVAIDASRRGQDRAIVDAALARVEVREQFAKLGVDATQIDARVAALTDAELRTLADRMQTMPAGGDALAVIGIVFIVLLILEAVGVIDIFKKFP
jgi:Family of unknown function (DUF6627)